jgi:hypothetical protein
MSETQAYFFAILTIGSLIYLLRERILSPNGPGHEADPDRQLSPTEAAYLTKEGDGGFAFIVILFDILHREVKEKIAGGAIETFDSTQRPYEVALKKAAGGSIKEWSLRKMGAVTASGRKDPVRFVTRLPAVYKLMRTGVEGTVREVIRDPRNIKKFISVPGLLRLAADIGATGYKTTLAHGLKEHLTEVGFLASDETRQYTIKLLLTTFALCQIILLVLILLTIPSQLHACLIYFCALFATVVVHACTGAREFIPLYSDLSRALAQVKSTNVRIAFVRIVLNLVTTLLNILSVIVFIVLFGCGSLFLYLTHTVASLSTYLMLIAQMLVQLIAFSYLVEAYKLTFGELPTKEAKQSLAVLKKKYRQEDTLPALKTMLGENDYSPDLSYLIALYGLETLFLI